jgi:uncharacterized protein (TIGR02246 family)
MERKAVLLVLCFMFLPMPVFAQGADVKEEAMLIELGGETREGVLTTLKSYIKAYESKDMEGVMAAFADSPNTVMMGTGPDEVWVGKDDIRRAHNAFMANSDQETSEQEIISVGAGEGFAWLTGAIAVTRKSGEDRETFQLNLSMVLEQDENTWYIKAMHFSKLTSP